MNQIITVIITFTIVLLASCSGNSTMNSGAVDPRDTVVVPEGITGEDSIAYIENVIVQSPISVEDLLGLAQVHSIEGMLAYCNDDELAAEGSRYAQGDKATHRDSAAMRLANRLMRMGNLVSMNGNASDKLNWAQAVNAALDLFRKEVPSLPADSALNEISRVIDKFSSQTQAEMNFQCYVDAMVDYYRTIESYRQWIAAAPAKLKPLVQAEYEAWHDLNEARFEFWNDVSYTREWYSMKPMEIEGYYECLSKNRRAELAIERGIILDGNDYRRLGTTVTQAQWEKWVTDHSVPEDIELIKEMEQEDEIPSDSLVMERVIALKSSFSRWLAARQAISAALPEQQGKYYDDMTADIHCRLIGKLKDIIPYGN